MSTTLLLRSRPSPTSAHPSFSGAMAAMVKTEDAAAATTTAAMSAAADRSAPRKNSAAAR